MNEFQDIYIDRIDLRGALTGSLSTDPPLLQELGIDFRAIYDETRLIFNPKSSFERCDITGPILFIFMYTVGLFFKGKNHFGYVYFITLCANILVYFLLNVLKNNRGVSFLKCFSVIGYAFLPVVFVSLVQVVLGRFLFLVSGVAAVWSSYVASVVFCRSLDCNDKLFIVGYPLLLVYLCYVLLIVF